jgi:hypothetical protein
VHVYAASGSSGNVTAEFTMKSGTISGNEASLNGGGVYVNKYNFATTAFTMEGGTISGNTSGSYGGGVYVKNAAFKKETGGIIYGKDEGENSNLVKNSLGVLSPNRGHAAYVDVSPAKKRETTAGEDTELDSARDINGGWE